MRRAMAATASALALALVGCTAAPVEPPTPTPTPSTERPFTVTTTEVPATYDPAAATTSADAIVALNTFSRLMVSTRRKQT